MRSKWGYVGSLYLCGCGGLNSLQRTLCLRGESMTELPVQDSKPSLELHRLLVTGEASCPVLMSSDNKVPLLGCKSRAGV